MKIGDKLLCKKIIVNYKNYCQYYPLDIGNWYEIEDINSISKNIRLIGEPIWFTPLYRSPHGYSAKKYIYSNFLWDYFYTPQEIRQMKLEKLNSV